MSSVKGRLGMGAVVAAAIAIATPIVTKYEGYAARVYVDPVGISTYCYGETVNPVPGRLYSEEYCRDLLSGRLGGFIRQVRKDVPSSVYMTPSELAAWGSFSYNVGSAAFRKSTAFQLLSQGKHVAACNQLSKWVYAGGKKFKGLVNRRAVEQAMCLRDYK